MFSGSPRLVPQALFGLVKMFSEIKKGVVESIHNYKLRRFRGARLVL